MRRYYIALYTLHIKLKLLQQIVSDREHRGYALLYKCIYMLTTLPYAMNILLHPDLIELFTESLVCVMRMCQIIRIVEIRRHVCITLVFKIVNGLCLELLNK